MQTIQGRPYFKVRSFSTLRDMLRQSVELYPDRIAFRFRDQSQDEPQTRTYRAFFHDVEALGTALTALGLAGRRLAIVGENSYQWCVAHAAVVCGVGIVVPLDRLLPGKEIVSLIDRGEIDAVFYDPSFHNTLLEAAQDRPHVRALICLRPGRLNKGTPPRWIQPDAGLLASTGVSRTASLFSLDSLLNWGNERLAAGDQTVRQAPIDPEALMSLLFTSGTTSISKAVMLSQRNICTEVQAVAGVVKLWPGIRMLSILPLHHTFENTCGLYMGLYYGAEIHECDGLRYIQKNLQDYHIEMVIGVPTLFENFYNKVQDTLRKTGKADLIRRLLPITQGLRKVGIDLRRILYKKIIAAFGGSLQLGICGAAPIDPEIIRFFDAVGIRILQGYGLTETSPVVAGCNSRLFVPGTVGHPVAGIELAVDADQPGDPGEILVRGPIVMQGYYLDPAATAEAIDQDGWFHTGDIGCLDPKTHCLTITGRLKSMIVLKNGKKVFPEEIEFLIGQSEFVKESLVWGEADGDGEVIVSAKMVVDPDILREKAGHDIDDNIVRQYLEQLIKDINSRLPSFKGIRQYVFSMQEMVKTTTLKIRRPIEIAGIREMMERQALKWREMTGRNLDHMPSHKS